MEIRLESRHLGEVAVLVPDIFQDSRGFFMEAFREDQFKALGLPSLYPGQSFALRERCCSGPPLSVGSADEQVDAGYRG
jgi:hypothetical protein